MERIGIRMLASSAARSWIVSAQPADPSPRRGRLKPGVFAQAD
jgi:hypothetical protein